MSEPGQPVPAADLRPTGLVSVVTPCLNPGPRLTRCLDSVAAQVGVSVEHIVIDGGSTDGTVDLLRTRSGIRWISEADSGQSQAINRGFALATGTVLTWLNADDWLEPGALQAVMAITDPALAMVTCGGCVVEEAGEHRTIPAPTAFDLSTLDQANPVAQPACFFTRVALGKAGPLDEDLHLTMDLDLWYRFVAIGVHYRTTLAQLAGIEVHGDAKTMAVPAPRWHREFARVRARHGRPVPAARDVGRAAAFEALDSGMTRPHEVDATVRQVLAERDEYASLPTREAAAAARFEVAARVGTRLAASLLVHPDFVRSRVARREIRSAVGRIWSSLIGGGATRARLVRSTSEATVGRSSANHGEDPPAA